MTTTSLATLVSLLCGAIDHLDQRSALIKQFQQAIWHATPYPSEAWVWDILADLAVDLDYYEPDPVARAEDPTYFGDERAEEEIRLALQMLEERAKHSPLP